MKNILLIIILIIFSFGSAAAQELSGSSKTGDLSFSSRYQKKLELENKIIYGESRFDRKDTIDLNIAEKKDNSNLKSPLIGGILSGLIPGAGEFYAKSYIKSAAFFAAEVGLWIAYGIFQKKGNDQTDIFQNYATQNWDMRKYAQWLKVQGFAKSGDINLSSPDEILRAQINACEEVNFSHTLPGYGEQQYFEVIGKYQNFLAGWSTSYYYDGSNNIVFKMDKNNYINYRSDQVSQYMSDRQTANDYFDKGSLMMTVVILNHIVSAADGVWSVIRYNERVTIKPEVSFHSRYSFNLQKSVIVPQFNVSVNF